MNQEAVWIFYFRYTFCIYTSYNLEPINNNDLEIFHMNTYNVNDNIF